MKKKDWLILVLLIVLINLMVSGCLKEQKSFNEKSHKVIQNESRNISIEKVEIYHFHGHQQCSSCIAVGNLAEETVNTYFADEMKSGKVVFAHINAQLPENAELAGKYGVTGSSLWIGVYDKNGFHAEQNTNVWYKINNKEDYMDYLKEIIKKRLAGDYT